MNTRRGSSRRQFLRGAGGFSLALPFMPSLLDPREAKAAATAAPAKRFVQICTQHGGIWGPNMYPADSTLTDSMSYGGRTVKRGKLAVQDAGGGIAKISPVLTGSSSLLTPSLASKMNVLRGLDVPWYIAHHTGGHLGNFARNDPGTLADYPTPTIDQVMGWSPKFYGDLSNILQRVMVVGPRISYNWSNPTSTTDRGPVQEVAQMDSWSFFNQVFSRSMSTAGTPDPNAGMSMIVDRVNADYLRLRNSSTRLSSDDRHRLDDHMQRIGELQRKLTASRAVSCPTLTMPPNPSKIGDSTYEVNPDQQVRQYEAQIDIIVAAILCDASRIGVVNIYYEDFSTYAGSWHQDVAHHAADPDGAMQKMILAAHQLMFEKVFLYLCNKLNVDDGTGKTYLDNSLLVWTQESGEYTHAGQGMPIVTAGGAAGFLSTGNYCDYRNTSIVVDGGEQGNTAKIYGGLLWQQWLGTALQAMGLSRADYEQNGLGGYPTRIKYIGKESMYVNSYPDAVWNVAGDVLPYLKA
jgi:hypothetical protein